MEHARRENEEFLQELLSSHLVLLEDWEKLNGRTKRAILATQDRSSALTLLVEHGLLNPYQVGRILAGATFGLVLGNYRVLERLGAGGMGIVFKAEHVRLRRQVAIKVLSLERDHSASLLLRFYSEVRAIAQFVHPNIVAAIDTGEIVGLRPDDPVLHYFVMEYVPGQDLEEYVLEQGPLDPTLACDIVQQVAAALSEAHKHNMVHRDIKPSNILLTPDGQAKLLDFGLARSVMRRLTEPGTVLGTLDFMAPEEVHDASAVDIRADQYALGGTLYWCLTGTLPFPPQKSVGQELVRRLTPPPPSVCGVRPDVPREVDAVVQRLMALSPLERYQTPEAVQDALFPWLVGGLRTSVAGGREETRAGRPGPTEVRRLALSELHPADRPYQVLVVDDDPTPRQFCCCVLRAEGIECDEASGGLSGLEMARARNYDLVLLDMDMPDLSGLEVCRRLREDPPSPHLKIITVSGLTNPDDMARMMLAGADDFLAKPFSVV